MHYHIDLRRRGHMIQLQSKGDEFLLHKMIAPFSINSRRTKNAGHGVMCSYYITVSYTHLDVYKRQALG